MSSFRREIKGKDLQQLTEYFKTEQWHGLTTEQKLSVVRGLEAKNASMHERKPSTVLSYQSATSNGSYNDIKDTISIDISEKMYVDRDGSIKKERKNPYKVMDTLYHESQHAVQDRAARNKRVVYDADQDTMDLMKLENFRTTKKNLKEGEVVGQYYNYDATIEYHNCLSEIDSNTVALQKVLDNSERYQNDHEYKEYLAERQRHFARYESLSKEEIKSQYKNAAEEAYNRKDLSQKKYDEYKKKIENSNLEVVDRAKEMYKRVGNEYTRVENLQNNKQGHEENIAPNQNWNKKQQEVEAAPQGKAAQRQQEVEAAPQGKAAQSQEGAEEVKNQQQQTAMFEEEEVYTQSERNQQRLKRGY